MGARQEVKSEVKHASELFKPHAHIVRCRAQSHSPPLRSRSTQARKAAESHAAWDWCGWVGELGQGGSEVPGCLTCRGAVPDHPPSRHLT